jgi:hypothetical protein
MYLKNRGKSAYINISGYICQPTINLKPGQRDVYLRAAFSAPRIHGIPPFFRQTARPSPAPLLRPRPSADFKP